MRSAAISSAWRSSRRPSIWWATLQAGPSRFPSSPELPQSRLRGHRCHHHPSDHLTAGTGNRLLRGQHPAGPYSRRDEGPCPGRGEFPNKNRPGSSCLANYMWARPSPGLANFVVGEGDGFEAGAGISRMHAQGVQPGLSEPTGKSRKARQWLFTRRRGLRATQGRSGVRRRNFGPASAASTRATATSCADSGWVSIVGTKTSGPTEAALTEIGTN